MRYAWGVAYAFLFAYRTFLSFLGETVVSNLTTLGDSGTYASGGFSSLSVTFTDILLFQHSRRFATELTENLGSVFNALFLGNTLMVHIAFQAMAFVGIVYLLRNVGSWQRSVLFLLFLFPSFSLWSSVAGKDAVVVLMICLLSVQVVRMIEGRAYSRVILLISLYSLVVYKAQYAPALLFLLVAIWAGRNVQQRTFLVFLGALVSLAFLYVFRERIDALAFQVIPNFSVAGGTTRPPFWVQEFDVFWRAPYGMLLSFFGPTLEEARLGILQLASFVESTILLGMISILLISQLARAPFFMFVVSATTVFWLIFANYPFGVMNPGSAIRYRTGYEPLLFVCLVSLLSRRAFLKQLRRDFTNRGRRAIPALAERRALSKGQSAA